LREARGNAGVWNRAPVLTSGEIEDARRELQRVTVREELLAYVLDVVRETRRNSSVLVGAGPRAMQGLLIASRACAALAGRNFVTPDDVKDMAVPVLSHRLVLRPEFEIEGVSVEEVIGRILSEVPVPR
jgi:MoxR-like ATPase